MKTENVQYSISALVHNAAIVSFNPAPWISNIKAVPYAPVYENHTETFKLPL